VFSARDRQQPDIAGRASGRAAALGALAGDREIVVNETARLLAGAYFEFQETGDHLLLGEGRPATCFKVKGASRVEHRLDRADALTPFVGRAPETALLERRWASAARGEGSSLLLMGEPGIGKSRLVHCLKESLADGACRVIELRCFFEFRQSPYRPLISFINSFLGVASRNTSPGRTDTLSRLLKRWWPDRADEILPLAADLLQPPLERTGSTSRRQRERTMAALFEMLGRLAGEKPVLLIMEDLHWIDPTTLEVVSKLVRKGIPNAVFLLMTARPEFEPPWPEAEMPRLRVAPMTDQDIGRLIAAASPGMPPDMRHLIAGRADGVPLFAEELSRLPVVSPLKGPLDIPATLQDLLAARLDGLADGDKKVVRLAATIGREFAFGLLATLTLLDAPETLAVLSRLRSAGLVSIVCGERWQFRHALIRDAAYLSQTRADRVSAHRRIAQVYESEFPELTEGRPELLAHHWSHAGAVREAADYWLRAGLLAQVRSAHPEAVKHFRAGLELLPRLEDAELRRALEWPLQVGMGASAYAAEGYASSQGAAAYHRAVLLGEQAGELQQNFPALWGLWAGASSHSSWKNSLQLARRLVKIVHKSPNPLARQQGNFSLGNVQYWRGEFEASCDCLERARNDYASRHHDDLVADYGENAYVTSGSYLSWGLCMRGLPRQALEVGHSAVAEGKRAGHPFSLGYALTFFTGLHRMLRQPAAGLELAEETIALAVRHDFPLWEAAATLERGWAKVMLGKPEGVPEMQRGADQALELMSGISPILLETHAEGLYHAGKPENALAVIERTLELADRMDDHHVEAELHRLKGACLLALSDTNSDRAEECLRNALRISRRQKALLPELRAAMSMADLLSRRNRADEGRTLLAAVYNRFTEGFDYPDLGSARKQMTNMGCRSVSVTPS
jgi:tetratricopeptide (TPR) repeat protein